MVRSVTRWWAIGLLSLLLCACRTDLFTQIPEQDANEVLDALYGAGIDAGKVAAGDSKFTVQVSEAQMGDALRVTRERGLPRQRYTDLGGLFKKEGLVSTPAEERVRFLYGVSQELAGTLAQIDGVVSARVHPVIPANDPLADKVKPTSAAIFIKHDPNANVAALAPSIKNLVMRSIEGLNFDNISLTFVAADPPARVAHVEPILPTWVLASLSFLAAAAVLSVGIAGFVLWRYRQLAATPEKSQSRAPNPGVASAALGSLTWLHSLWHGRQPNRSTAATNEPKFEPPRANPGKALNS